MPMSEPDDSPSVYATVAAAFGIPALIAAFVFQPAVAILNEGQRVRLWVLLIVVMAALGLALSYPIDRWLRAVIVAAACYFLAIGWTWIAHPNVVTAAANDRRCLAIQGDMLSARPRRSDGPDLFQALGCRPQGEGNVFAPPPKR
jgi:hypothetical protein